MTAAERVKLYLEARSSLPWQEEIVAWAANAELGTRELTVADLEELLAEANL